MGRGARHKEHRAIMLRACGGPVIDKAAQFFKFKLKLCVATVLYNFIKGHGCTYKVQDTKHGRYSIQLRHSNCRKTITTTATQT